MKRFLLVSGLMAIALCGCDKKPNHGPAHFGGGGGGGNVHPDPAPAPPGPNDPPVDPGPPPRPRRTIQGMVFIDIPSGSFIMGAPPTEPGYQPYQKQRLVDIPAPFWLSQTEITQDQFERVAGKNPSFTKGVHLPVTGVTWDEAQEYAEKLAVLDPAYTFRLPTSEEWEYACRAGSDLPFAPPQGKADELREAVGKHLKGDPDYLSRYLARFAWIQQGGPQPVAMLLPNAWDLFDMHGNAWEWCADDGFDPVLRPLRGGGWGTVDVFGCRAAVKDWAPRDTRKDSFGFRVVAELRE